jgi:hypothetical protein
MRENSMRKFLLCAALAALSAPALAGGRLETFKVLGPSPSPPVAGALLAEVIPIVWDDRCTNVNYTINTLVDPAGAGGPIPFASWAPEMQASLNPWNAIPTSYINMNVTGSAAIVGPNAGVPGLRSFNMINELTFQTPVGSGFLASSPSVSFVVDVTLNPGDLIDGDADSDVYDPALATPAGRTDCHDFDGDGDIEFSAGFYKAGTVLENDVEFNNRLAPSIVWELTPTSTALTPAFTLVLPRKTDIQAVAVHEFGHSHSLSHSMINQISSGDGTGSTMFPFIDIDDRFSEIGSRSLHEDDIAWSSYVYPEGNAASGPGALQAGDIAFTSKYRLISGSLTQGAFGVLGGSLQARKTNSKAILSEAYSGFARVSTTPTLSGFFAQGNAFNVIDGDYEIPVPKGTYHIEVEALDGDPAAAGNISITAIVGNANGQLTFAEEFRSAGPLEDNLEHIPAQSVPVQVNSGSQSGVNVVTNDTNRLRNAGAITNLGTASAFTPLGVADVIYAERFSNAAVLAQLNAGALMTTGTFRTGVFDASVVGVWKRAGLFLGTVNGDGTAAINLAAPIASRTEFVGQDGDSTPFFIPDPEAVSLQVQNALTADPTLEVFLVLEQKNDYNTADDPRPPLLGLQAVAASAGRSYLSVAGGPFAPRPTQNWIVELHFTPAGW